MEERELLMNGRGFSSPRGDLALWLPAPHLMLVRMRGFGESDFAVPILAAFESNLIAGRRPYMFFDMQHMQGYDPKFRLRLTSKLIAMKDYIAGWEVITGSKLASMSISVANLAMGQRIVTHRERARFIAAADAIIQRAGVVGFSCADALSAV